MQVFVEVNIQVVGIANELFQQVVVCRGWQLLGVYELQQKNRKPISDFTDWHSNHYVVPCDLLAYWDGVEKETSGTAGCPRPEGDIANRVYCLQ